MNLEEARSLSCLVVLDKSSGKRSPSDFFTFFSSDPSDWVRSDWVRSDWVWSDSLRCRLRSCASAADDEATDTELTGELGAPSSDCSDAQSLRLSRRGLDVATGTGLVVDGLAAVVAAGAAAAGGKCSADGGMDGKPLKAAA